MFFPPSSSPFHLEQENINERQIRHLGITSHLRHCRERTVYTKLSPRPPLFIYLQTGALTLPRLPVPRPAATYSHLRYIRHSLCSLLCFSRHQLYSLLAYSDARTNITMWLPRLKRFRHHQDPGCTP